MKWSAVLIVSALVAGALASRPVIGGEVPATAAAEDSRVTGTKVGTIKLYTWDKARNLFLPDADIKAPDLKTRLPLKISRFTDNYFEVTIDNKTYWVRTPEVVVEPKAGLSGKAKCTETASRKPGTTTAAGMGAGEKC